MKRDDRLVRHRTLALGTLALGTLVLGALALALTTGCAPFRSATTLAAGLRTTINARHATRVVELRHSCFYGDLYDENEKWLLSPYPFGDIHHIVDINGNPIRPRNERGILPAGTRFVIEKIEFPDEAALAHRMLTTPRYNPWVYLRPTGPGAKRLSEPQERPFILLLPMDLASEDGVEAAIAAQLAPEGEVQRWVEKLRPSVRVAVAFKDTVEGMTPDELAAAWGEPLRWLSDRHGAGPARVAWYGSKEVWFLDGDLVEVRPGRPLDASVPADSAVATGP